MASGDRDWFIFMQGATMSHEQAGLLYDTRLNGGGGRGYEPHSQGYLSGPIGYRTSDVRYGAVDPDQAPLAGQKWFGRDPRAEGYVHSEEVGDADESALAYQLTIAAAAGHLAVEDIEAELAASRAEHNAPQVATPPQTYPAPAEVPAPVAAAVA